MAQPVEIPGIASLPDRYVPRFEVFFAKPGPKPGPAPVENLLDPEQALAAERARLDGSMFIAGRGDPPKLNQLLPLAGPWGEKRDQRTDDILSVAFTESVEESLPLAQVTLEVLNVYDSVKQAFRYTDIPPNLKAEQAGVYPLLDYGDTIALRVGYGSHLEWVFEGIVSKLSVSFPADGESRVSITAVDKRDRLRGKKDVDTKSSGNMAEQQLVQQIARPFGLKVAWPSADPLTTNKGKKTRSKDQDALQFVTDRLKKSKLELLCFGDTLFLYNPGDDASEALVYNYRAGLTSFEPTFNAAGKSTRVRVEARNPTTGEDFVAEASTRELAELGLIPPLEEERTALDKIESSGQAGERTDIVTNYRCETLDQAKRYAVAILKRNLDETITATGNVVGDPRVRARKTIKIGGVGRFNGLYYVTSATHRLGPNGYQTEFKARRNKALPERGASATNT